MHFDNLKIALEEIDSYDPLVHDTLEELDIAITSAMLVDMTMEEVEVFKKLRDLSKSLAAIVALEDHSDDAVLLKCVIESFDLPADTSYVTAMEGFWDGVKKTWETIVDWIKKIIAQIREFIFGKSQEDLAKETADKVDAFLRDDDKSRAAIVELQTLLGQGEGKIASLLRIAGLNREFKFSGFSADEASAVQDRIQMILQYMKATTSPMYTKIPDNILAAADLFAGDKAIKLSTETSVAATWNEQKVAEVVKRNMDLGKLFDEVKKSYYPDVIKTLNEYQGFLERLASGKPVQELDAQTKDENGNPITVTDPKQLTALVKAMIKRCNVAIRIYTLCDLYFQLVNKTIKSYLDNAKLIKKAIAQQEKDQKTKEENNA